MEAGTISSNYSRLSICQMFLFHQNCCNYLFQDSLLSISKKEKGECDFDTEVFSSCKFCKSLIFREPFLYCRSPVVLLLFVVLKIVSFIDGRQTYVSQQTVVFVKTCWRCLENIFRATFFVFQVVFKTSSRHACKTSSWSHIEDVLTKIFREHTLKTSLEEALTCEDVLEDQKIVTLRTFSKHPKNVLKYRKFLLR